MPEGQPRIAIKNPWKRRRLVILIVVGVLIIAGGWAFNYFYLQRSMGSGPAGPAVEGAAFSGVWTPPSPRSWAAASRTTSRTPAEQDDLANAREQLSRRSGPRIEDPVGAACKKLQSSLELYVLGRDLAKAKEELRAAKEIIRWLPETTRAKIATKARLRDVATGLQRGIDP